MIESITLRGLLSFGWTDTTLPLRPLNVLIGPNGGGKTNLLDCLDLLRAVPGNGFSDVARAKGGADEWPHKGAGGDGRLSLEVVLADPRLLLPLRYATSFEVTPREHLRRCQARRVDGGDEQYHLMAQVMEAWFLADPDRLAAFYGQGFQRSALPGQRDVEKIPKTDVLSALHRATKKTTKGQYHKLEHAADLLREIDPRLVCSRAGHCQRLFSTLRLLMRESEAGGSG